jgi:mono/diheme cytochrome c family protein
VWSFAKGLLAGAAALGAFVILLAAAVAASGAYDVAADAPHLGLTKALIGYVRERSIETRARGISVPPLGKPEMVAEGAEHYDAMCTGCHLAPGMRDNEMRPGMNPRPPEFAKLPAGNPAEQFWVIKHGIKMTAMPAWGTTHSDEEIWNMVALLQKLPKLGAAKYRALVAASGKHHDDDMNMGH